MSRTRALVFVGLTLGLSYPYEALLISKGGLESLGSAGILALMWVPGAVAVALTLRSGGKLKDLGLSRGTRKTWLAAFLVPIACGVFTYGASLAFGIVHFAPPADAVAAGRTTVASWATGIPLQLAAGSVVGSLFGLGEELGWRGYLVPRLTEARVPLALVVSGIIWGLWHLPLILWGNYATSRLPVVSALQFMAVVTLAAICFGWLRLESGSVFPPMLAHAVHNVVYQGVFDRWFDGPNEPFFAGEQGLFSTVAYGIVAAVLLRKMRKRSSSAQGAKVALS